MEGLDDLETQFDVLAFGTYDEQLVMLQDVLDDIAGANDIEQYVRKLYDAYLTDDAASLDALLKRIVSNRRRTGRQSSAVQSVLRKNFYRKEQSMGKKNRGMAFRRRDDFYFCRSRTLYRREFGIFLSAEKRKTLSLTSIRPLLSRIRGFFPLR